MLHESRPVGYAVGAIPLCEIEAYCRIHRIDDVPEFTSLIRSMDRAFLEWHRNKQANRTNLNGPREIRRRN